MPTEREIWAGAKALAMRKVHVSKLTDALVESFVDTARQVLVAAEAEKIHSAELLKD